MNAFVTHQFCVRSMRDGRTFMQDMAETFG